MFRYGGAGPPSEKRGGADGEKEVQVPQQSAGQKKKEDDAEKGGESAG